MPRSILIALGMCALLIFALFAFEQGNYLMLSAGVMLPLLIMFASRADILLIAICMTCWSNLRIPGFLGAFTLYQALLVVYLVVAFARSIIQKSPNPSNWARKLAWAFLAVLLITAYGRGMGVRFLGGNMEGGNRYIQIVLCVLFYLMSDHIRLSTRQWKWAVGGMLFLGFIPFAANLIFVLTGGRIFQQLYFVDLDANVFDTADTFLSGQETRWVMFNNLARLYLVPFVFFPFVQRNLLRYVFFVAFGLLVASLGGNRTTLIVTTAFIWLFLFFHVRRKAFFVTISAGAGSLLVLLLGYFAYLLPFPIQRMVSFLPHAQISETVRLSAMQTTQWRIWLWEEGLRQVDRFLWLGKGFAYNAVDNINAMRYQFTDFDQVNWAIVQGDYHQGVLSTLVLLGVFGALTFWGVVIVELVRHFRLNRALAGNEPQQRYHFVLLLVILVQFLAYLTFSGQAHVDIPALFFLLALLNGLLNERRDKPTPA